MRVLSFLCHDQSLEHASQLTIDQEEQIVERSTPLKNYRPGFIEKPAIRHIVIPSYCLIDGYDGRSVIPAKVFV